MDEPTSTEIMFHEAQFVSLPGQSNIYGLLNLSINGSNKLVVATVRGDIFCLEFHKGSQRPLLTPINFTYIPGDAEVISIDAVTKNPNGVVIGVALVKGDSDSKEIYLNLYGIHSDSAAPFHWDKIAEDWQPLTLKFIPLQLTHAQILAGEQWETVFLLSGDDLKVHMYREVWQSELCFQEENSELWFPELQDLPSSVTYMDMRTIGHHRLTALGCQNGYLKCALVDLTSRSVEKEWNTKIMDGPITSVRLFSLVSEAAAGTKDHSGQEDFHLLVTSAVELGAVFMNVVEEGFNQSLVLPSSHLHDSVLCSEVADVNWDGQNELILGTYGKEILVYEFHKNVDHTMGFQLAWKRSFAHPIHCVWYGDLTHDGLCELVIISLGGVHILQHDLTQAGAVCLSRLVATTTDSGDRPATSNGDSGDRPTTSNGDSGDRPTTSNGDSGDRPTTSNGDSGDRPTTSNGDSGDRPTTSNGDSGDRPTTSNGDSGDRPTTSNGDSGDRPTTSNGDPGDRPTTSNGDPGDSGQLDKEEQSPE